MNSLYTPFPNRIIRVQRIIFNFGQFDRTFLINYSKQVE